MSTSATLPLRLARWFEARLHASMSPPTALVRRYGLELIDDDGLELLRPDAARVVFLGEAADCDPPPAADPGVDDFDAEAIVVHRWLVRDGASFRPGTPAVRRRARVVLVRCPEGMATVTRFDDDPDVVLFGSAA
jgi:hypothetical protein